MVSDIQQYLELESIYSLAGTKLLLLTRIWILIPFLLVIIDICNSSNIYMLIYAVFHLLHGLCRIRRLVL